MYAPVRDGCTVAYEGFERPVSTRLAAPIALLFRC
jgi:hypothetical protein